MFCRRIDRRSHRLSCSQEKGVLKQALLKQPNGAIALVDATKTEMTSATVTKAKAVIAATEAAGIPDGPSVVVGLTGLQKATAQLFG